jgi:hypothetical protein
MGDKDLRLCLDVQGSDRILHEQIASIYRLRASPINQEIATGEIGMSLFGSGVVWLWFYVVGDIVLKRLSGKEQGRNPK